MDRASPSALTRLPMLNFAHGETLDMLRETVQSFAAADRLPLQVGL